MAVTNRAFGERGDREPDAVPSSDAPPPWLASCVAEFGPIQHRLAMLRTIRAIAFGGTLVFVALLAFLLGNSPVGEGFLLVVSLCGLPICLVTWFAASRMKRRLSQKKNRIEQRMYGAGLHLDDAGRVVTDSPRPAVIFDARTGRVPDTP